MTEENPKIAPLPTVRRLPAYLSILRQLHAAGRQVVSGTYLADQLGLESIQVRKDLAYTGIVGKPGVGFEVVCLIEAIEGFLGWNNTTDAFLIGAGSLGRALLGYHGFARHGLNIAAAFDTDPAKIGQTIHEKPVLPMDKLENLVQRMHVHLGILAVPAAAAQRVADEVVAAGIKAIWNFTSVPLKVPASVIVHSTELSAELAVLSVMVAQQHRRELRAGGLEVRDKHPPSCSSAE